MFNSTGGGGDAKPATLSSPFPLLPCCSKSFSPPSSRTIDFALPLCLPPRESERRSLRTHAIEGRRGTWKEIGEGDVVNASTSLSAAQQHIIYARERANSSLYFRLRHPLASTTSVRVSRCGSQGNARLRRRRFPILDTTTVEFEAGGRVAPGYGSLVCKQGGDVRCIARSHFTQGRAFNVQTLMYVRYDQSLKEKDKTFEII